MGRNVIYLILILLLLSCSLRKFEKESVYGTFYKKNHGRCYRISYELEIRKDGTFVFNEESRGVNPKYYGKWKIVGGNHIMLKCTEDTTKFDPSSFIHVNLKKWRIKILSKNKLKFDNIVLKRNK